MPIEEFAISLLLENNLVQEYNYKSRTRTFESKYEISSSIIKPIVYNKKHLIYCVKKLN